MAWPAAAHSLGLLIRYFLGVQSISRSVDQSEATRQSDGLHAILDLQLFEDVAQMPLHGVGRDRQAIGQIFVAEAVREKAQQAALLLAEAGDQFRKTRVDIGERGLTAFASLGQQPIEMQPPRVQIGKE